METILRWLLIQSGLPHPLVQTKLRDSAGRTIARADLYYPESRLVLEYDGGNHRDRMVDDNRRQNLLINAGYQVLRFTFADINSRADVVIAQVQAALKGTSGARRVKSMSSKTRLAPNVSNSGSRS
jgi:very-short-patch-repair endonuclease